MVEPAGSRRMPGHGRQDWPPLDVVSWDPCPVTWEAVLVFLTASVNRVQVLLRTEGGAVDLIDPCRACRVA